ncbi:MAG: hypothetical protein ACTSQA_06750, partial [Candidatus Heimdallarchaeaceae archaeon]
QINKAKEKVSGIKTGIEALSASDLTEGAGQVNVPDIGDQDTNAEAVSKGADSTASSAVGVVNEEEQRLKDEAEARQKEIDEAAKTKASWLSKLTTTGKTSEQKLEEEEEEAGVAGLSDDVKAQRLKVAGLQGDMAKLDIKEQAELDRLNERTGGMGWGSAEANTIQGKFRRDRAYLAAELYAESTVLSAFSNNLTDAKNSAKDAVDAFTYDQEQEVKRFEYLYDYHSDFLDSLKAEDKAIIDEAKIAAQDAKDKMEAEKTDVMNLLLQYPNAGIKISDTVEEATAKASTWSGVQPSEFDLWKQKVDYEAGVTAGALDENQKASLLALISEIPGYPDKETALADLEANKTAIILQVGQGGYTQLINEVNRKLETQKPTDTRPLDIRMKAAGSLFGESLKRIPEVYIEAAGKIKDVAGGFWSGLFGD